MNALTLAWDLLPPLTAVGVLIGWLAGGRSTPWMVGWQISLPLLALVPMWADVAMQIRGKRVWKNFPGTCYLVMTLIVVIWSLGFISPGSVLSNAEVCGPVPATCVGGVLKMTEPGANCLDVARIDIDMQDTTASAEVSVYTVYSNCWDCLPRRVYHGNGRTPDLSADAFYIPTAHSTDVFSLEVVIPHSPEESFNETFTDADFRDQGVYRLMVNPAQRSAEIVKTKDPWNYAAPLVVLVVGLLFLQFVYAAGNKAAGYAMRGIGVFEAIGMGVLFWKTYEVGLEGEGLLDADGDDDDDDGDKKKKKKSTRIQALDVFRGISLVIMNTANYGGFGYWFLDHSKWDGLTVADLVFPWFVWIMGVAMAITLEGRRVRENRVLALIHVVRRASLLVLIGMLLDTENQSKYSTLRIPGVLQRFGLSYFTVSLAIFFVPKRATPSDEVATPAVNEGTTPPDEGLGSFLWKWGNPTLREAPIFLSFAAAWVAISLGTSFTRDGEECSRYLGPGGISQQGKHFNCTGGTANYLDSKLFGTHTWHGCFPCDTYMNYDVANMTCQATVGHDPEGFLGVLNSILLCWLGLVTGRIIAAGKALPDKRYPAVCLGGLGFVLCLVAASLAEFKQFGGAIPVNKNLWSTSFVALMAGTGTLSLLVLLVAVDWFQLWNGKPFLFVGMNSILYYSMHEIMNNYIPFTSTGGANDTHASKTISNSLGVATNVVIVYWLYRNGLFLKI